MPWRGLMQIILFGPLNGLSPKSPSSGRSRKTTSVTQMQLEKFKKDATSLAGRKIHWKLIVRLIGSEYVVSQQLTQDQQDFV